MKKISFKNIFKKSESDKSTGMGKKMILLFLILLISVGAGVYFGYPLLFPGKTAVLPIVKKTISNPAPTEVVPEIINELEVIEKTKFDIEIEQREGSYENKIFTYEPYESPSDRNPFQKVRNFYSSGEIINEEQIAQAQEGPINFPTPGLPPGTLLTGKIGRASCRERV